MFKNYSLKNETTWLQLLIVLAVIINLSGLFVPLMDPDAGVYATLSKNIVLRNNFSELFFQGNDWLDKPHFPFWVTAVFFKCFGIHTWSYKLPGILFCFLGAIYTYLFTKKFYSTYTALWATAILLTAEHIVISNNDVRAEAFLVALIMGAVYHFSILIYSKTNKKILFNLIIACFYSACAVMTKGIFTLIPIGFSIIGECVMKKKWKELLYVRWLLAVLLITIFITPELYSLWIQFDKHPEKIVFNRQGVSGIRFFLWDSQFGRFFNNGPIKGKGDPTFFLHTLLWAFLPWSVVMYIALWKKIKTAFQLKNSNHEEWFSFSGAIITLLVFSFSKFQLPYYTNIIFPFLSILTAKFITIDIAKNGSKFIQIFQNIITIVIFIALILLQYFYAPNLRSPVAIVFLIFIVMLMAVALHKLVVNGATKSLYRACLAGMAFNLYFNTQFYPDLLHYQSGNEAAFFMNKNYPDVTVVCMNIYSPSAEFYLNSPLIKTDTSAILQSPNNFNKDVFFVREEELHFFERNNLRYQTIQSFKDFHVTGLTLPFINKKTRNGVLKNTYLIKLN